MSKGRSAGTGVFTLAMCFLAISVPVETAYSWRNGLGDPYYLVKLAGWALLAAGAAKLYSGRRATGLAFAAAGLGWLAANFWRAVADRVSQVALGQALRLGSIELWFAGSCLLVTVVGLAWCLVLVSRNPSV